MADALCGPSNALSSFQKHTSIDRTLQQDRLASQRSHEQGFRSAPGPNASIIDAEFKAFQAGKLPQLHDAHEEHHFHNAFPAHGSSQSFQPPQPQLPGWAFEFQNMNLNDVQPSPAPAPQFRQFAPPQPSQEARWQQDFMQQSAMSQRPQIPPIQRTDSGGLVYSLRDYLDRLDAKVQQEEYDRMTKQAQSQDVDDALLEKHFEAAALEANQAMSQAEANIKPMSGETVEEAQQQQQYEQVFDNTTLLGPSIQIDHHREPVIDASPQDPIGSDLILEKNKGKGKEREDLDDADELARTAGSLLENVKHDQSQKFKQSNFLSLMRQLRDREVRVEGDKLVDVSMPTSSS